MITSMLENFISNERLILIEASKLSLTDEFMDYKPKVNRDRKFMKQLSHVISEGVNDFIRPVCDPSFVDKESTKICYEFGKKPAIGQPYFWWEKVASEIDKNCRLGTKNEYIAFLGILIKMLVESGWSISKAWHAICVDSKSLGNYWNTNKKHNIELTGTRKVCKFYDLANTCKILSADEQISGYWIAGGDFDSESSINPIGRMDHFYGDYNVWNNSVGWIVFECEDKNEEIEGNLNEETLK